MSDFVIRDLIRSIHQIMDRSKAFQYFIKSDLKLSKIEFDLFFQANNIQLDYSHIIYSNKFGAIISIIPDMIIYRYTAGSNRKLSIIDIHLGKVLFKIKFIKERNQVRMEPTISHSSTIDGIHNHKIVSWDELKEKEDLHDIPDDILDLTREDLFFLKMTL